MFEQAHKLQQHKLNEHLATTQKKLNNVLQKGESALMSNAGYRFKDY
jgi:uncharacterized protein (UPF0216 family)